MTPIARTGLTRTTLLALAAAVIACSDDPTGNDPSPLSGLQQRAAADSAGNPPPAPPAPPVQPTPGTFRGTVLAPAPSGGGNDTLATKPRIAGVVVTAYPRLDGDAVPPKVGAAVASVTTGADGMFQLPTLPGGEYVVTFTPPATSEYGGVWVTATASAQSANYPWWVTLWKK